MWEERAEGERRKMSAAAIFTLSVNTSTNLGGSYLTCLPFIQLKTDLQFSFISRVPLSSFTSTCEDVWHRHFARGWTPDPECPQGTSEVWGRMLYLWFPAICETKCVEASLSW